MNATSSRSSSDAFRSRITQPRRLAASWSLRVDAADVAERRRAFVLAEQRADAVAQPGQVVTADRPVDRERKRALGTEGHQRIDGKKGANSSVLWPMSFAPGAGLTL